MLNGYAPEYVRNTLRKSTKGSVGGGTPWYMSIESFGTESSDIHARDIWAFGATLYEIITGDVPFGQYGGVSQKTQNGKIPPIKSNVSEELKQLVYDCLALDAWDRPDADEIVKRAKDHISGITPPPTPVYKKVIIVLSTLVLVAGCYFIYPYVLFPKKGNPVSVNNNDSIYLAKINEAVSITESEREKKDLSTVNETALCSAAKIYTDASRLEVTDSIKEKGNQMWVASQQVIDNVYEYLYNKGIEYREMGAESASQNFSKRSIVLSDYVTPSKRRGNYILPNRTSKSIDVSSSIHNPYD